MKGLVIWLLGAVPFFVLGYFTRSFVIFWKRGTCQYVVEQDDGGYQECPGNASTRCMEKLCPAHCNELHKGKCREQPHQSRETK